MSIKQQVTLMNVDDIYDGMKQSFQFNEINLLLIKTGGNIYVIENRCGHFGASLDNGKLDIDSIRCNHHLARFSLLDGSVLNDVVDGCDKLKIFDWKVENQQLVVFIS